MAVIETFSGRRVEIPETLRYHAKQGLWAEKSGTAIRFGFTQPAIVLMGGVRDMDLLVDPGMTVNAGTPVIFAITGKILYLDTPVTGAIHYNRDVLENPEPVNTDPYGQGWLFRIDPCDDMDRSYSALTSPDAYLESLRATDGFRNPAGLKGGVSGMCKAVYSGISSQKL